MSSFGWAIVGPGAIAHRFAEAVSKLPGCHLAAVVSRDAARARAFAAHWHADAHITTELQPALTAPGIDGVYVATPHPFHAAPTLAALAAKKAVLCEKPLTLTERSASALIAAAKSSDAFLMEAVWTRFLPAYKRIGQWLQDGAIGAVRGVQSSFCFATPFNPHSRLFAKPLGGGALLDIGVYCLSMSQWAVRMNHRDASARTVLAHGQLAPTGVDQRVSASVEFECGVTTQFLCATDMHADSGFRIYGEQGAIVVPHRFWEATAIELHRPGHEALREAHPLVINGFEGQITEAMRCHAIGAIQSPVVPHHDTLQVMQWMDSIREKLGVNYEDE
jgi:predicted dehydrogenase